MSRATSAADGFCYAAAKPFGEIPLGALFTALAAVLDDHGLVEFINPAGPEIESWLQVHAVRSKRSLLRPARWTLVGPSGLQALAAFTPEVRRCAVWFTVFDRDGRPVFEAEEGNIAIWISTAVPPAARSHIAAAAGASAEPVRAAALSGSRFDAS